MKKSNSLTNRSGLAGLVVFSLSVLFGVSSCKPDYDLDTHFPEWLGTSIYQTLLDGFEGDNGQEYHFSYFVRLIDSLDQRKVLDKTGSKTLFVADDAAFERFFGENCPFKRADGHGVSCFEELSKAQMNMILKGSMLNNVYQVAALSTSGGDDQNDPVKGNCMRRVTSSSAIDSIPIIYLDRDLPDPEHNPFWEYLTKDSKIKNAIPIVQDGTSRSIVFFVNKFLEMNKITDGDYNFLFNQGDYPLLHPTGKPGREPNEASVNGIKIETQNKKCFNGFIHVMSDVVYLLPNMAEYLSRNDAKSKSTIYSSIIERFSVPKADATLTSQVKDLIEQGYITSKSNPELVNALADDGDYVYVKRYFSENNRDYRDAVTPFIKRPEDDKPFDQQQSALRFDPGWNGYFTPVPGSREDNEKLLQHNMAVMLVPTDKALSDWWLKYEGVSLRERYGKAIYKGRTDLTYAEVADDMDSIPYKVISKLLNNNMLYSLVGSVPSKFAGVLNDANDPMFEGQGGVSDAIASIDSVVMCCNGAIYFTNKVYAPTAYRSVSYPTLVNEKLDIINMAIENKTLSFSAYLNSMVSTYSFFVPVVRDENDEELPGKLVWIDPVSFPVANGGGYYQAVVFGFSQEKQTIVADWYDYDPIKNKLISGASRKTLYYTAPEKLNDDETPESQIIMNRLADLLDYHIIIGDIEKTNSSLDMNDYRYFQTKGRGTVRIKTAADMVNNYGDADVCGGWQIEQKDPVKIIGRYDLSENGNGRTYLIDRPLFTSRNSVYDILKNDSLYPEFQSFYKLMSTAAGRLTDSKVNKKLKKDNKLLFATLSNGHAIGSERNVSTLNTYHYTLYVPTNASVDALLKSGVIYSEDSLKVIKTHFDSIQARALRYVKQNFPKLKTKQQQNKADTIYRDSLKIFSKNLRGVGPDAPTTPEDENFDLTEFLEGERTRLKNFLKYHIQDNSVYANAEFNVGMIDEYTPATEASFETAYMDDGQFMRVTVSGGQDITVKDESNNTRYVQKGQYSPNGAPYWNIMCREYEYNTSTVSATTVYDTKIETSSYVVIHLIDQPLLCPSLLKR